jgi:hypothetical protein
MTSEERGHVEPVFAPSVPRSDRQRLESHPEALVPASDPTPHRQTAWNSQPLTTLGSMLVWVTVCAGVWAVVFVVLALALPPEVTAWIGLALAAVGVIATVVVGAGFAVEDRYRKLARQHHGRYLLAADFDDEAAALMLRCQRAVRQVLNAKVTTLGLLDEIQNELVLPEQLWDIGRVLQQQSVLRTKQREATAGIVTPELEAVLGPQRQALARSVAAMEKKVVAIENYAHRVRVADAALRAEEALQDDDAYLELLIQTESPSDRTVVNELSEDANHLHATLSRSIAAAREAGKTLSLGTTTMHG